MTNSVFQGTILGSPLWKIFYADARKSVNNRGYVESVFADDFNAWKGFVATVDIEVTKRVILTDLEEAQRELHLWGKANQVKFDPSKESFHILHRRFHHGDDFKILGVTFDVGLLMHTAAREISTEAGWRLQTLLRASRFFTTPEMVHLYKASLKSRHPRSHAFRPRAQQSSRDCCCVHILCDRRLLSASSTCRMMSCSSSQRRSLKRGSMLGITESYRPSVSTSVSAPEDRQATLSGAFSSTRRTSTPP